tara:strand:- start:92 stop:397 length:306 start_codon:yes stop_codon:yes gene_type:complete
MWLYIWLVYSAIGGIISMWFLYVWGWGDASWNKPPIHIGLPSDLWHRRRRRAFYAVAIWAVVGNPFCLLILGVFGRQTFRKGVWDVDDGNTHKRWYGGDLP